MKFLEMLVEKLAHRKVLAFFVGMTSFLVVAFVDIITSEEFSFAVFYLAPIALFVWIFGNKWGAAVAVASVVVWPSQHIFSGDIQYFRSLFPYWESGIRAGFYIVFITSLNVIQRHIGQLNEINSQLKQALSDIKQLSGLLPMCSNCKRIRDDTNRWVVLEKYIQTHSDATVSHGVCPECAQKLYPELYEKVLEKTGGK